jgi:hypothetical protein
MKIKTSELIDQPLDWAVGMALKLPIEIARDGAVRLDVNECRMFTQKWVFEPSTDWSQGGPIIEREGLTVMMYSPSCQKLEPGREWYACTAKHWDDYKEFEAEGPTPLIAAMRCYVASKLGDEVEVPDELISKESGV